MKPVGTKESQVIHFMFLKDILQSWTSVTCNGGVTYDQYEQKIVCPTPFCVHPNCTKFHRHQANNFQD